MVDRNICQSVEVQLQHCAAITIQIRREHVIRVAAVKDKGISVKSFVGFVIVRYGYRCICCARAVGVWFARGIRIGAILILVVVLHCIRRISIRGPNCVNNVLLSTRIPTGATQVVGCDSCTSSKSISRSVCGCVPFFEGISCSGEGVIVENGKRLINKIARFYSSSVISCFAAIAIKDDYGRFINLRCKLRFKDNIADLWCISIIICDCLCFEIIWFNSRKRGCLIRLSRFGHSIRIKQSPVFKNIPACKVFRSISNLERNRCSPFVQYICFAVHRNRCLQLSVGCINQISIPNLINYINAVIWDTQNPMCS